MSKNKKNINYPLSSSDIKKIFNKKIKIILYSDLSKYKTIEDVLKPHNKVMILYYWESPNEEGEGNYFGHWVCFFKNNKNMIEVFNSFGGYIDDTLKQIDKDFREDNNEDFKYLTNLLYDYCIKTNDKVVYNAKQLQAKVDTATCGRWCCYRMLRNDLSIIEFNRLFKNLKTNDNKICKITNKLLL